MSIYLKKDSVNKVAITLSESSRITSPNYLFIFKNDYNPNANEIAWTGDDESISKSRYNLFTIEEASSGSTTGGTSVVVNMVAGQYTYKVYESSTPTLDIAETTGVILQTGIMVVDDVSSSYIDEIIPSQNNNTPSIYD